MQGVSEPKRYRVKVFFFDPGWVTMVSHATREWAEKEAAYWTEEIGASSVEILDDDPPIRVIP